MIYYGRAGIVSVHSTVHEVYTYSSHHNTQYISQHSHFSFSSSRFLQLIQDKFSDVTVSPGWKVQQSDSQLQCWYFKL